MSAPVAATCATGVNGACSTGRAKTATRAPIANERVAAVTAASASSASANAGGQITAMPPAKASTDRPPRKPAKTGQAWPAIAPATAAYTAGTLAPAGTPSAPACQPLTASPSSPATAPLARSPANTGTARRAPSSPLTFQKPGLRSPASRGSTPCARATSTATGTEPTR